MNQPHPPGPRSAVTRDIPVVLNLKIFLVIESRHEHTRWLSFLKRMFEGMNITAIDRRGLLICWSELVDTFLSLQSGLTLPLIQVTL